jgi:hypothetical protein
MDLEKYNKEKDRTRKWVLADEDREGGRGGRWWGMQEGAASAKVDSMSIRDQASEGGATTSGSDIVFHVFLE